MDILSLVIQYIYIGGGGEFPAHITFLDLMQTNTCIV
jgi:hypothetical protein